MPVLTDPWAAAPPTGGYSSTPMPSYLFSGTSPFYHPSFNIGQAVANGLAGTQMGAFSNLNWSPPGAVPPFNGVLAHQRDQTGLGALGQAIDPVLTHPPDPQWALLRHQLAQNLAQAQIEAASNRQQALKAQALGLKQNRQNRRTDLSSNVDDLAANNLIGGYTEHFQQGKINLAHQQQAQSINQQTAAQLASIANQMAQARLSFQQGMEGGALAHQQYQQNNSYYINPGSMTGPGGKVVAVASHQLGVPYVWGGESPHGFDCSGLYYWAENRAGNHIPRTTAEGYLHMTHAIGRAGLRPGDAVFFAYGTPGYADHMGIYIGNGRMIVAPHTGANVQIQTVDWGHFIRGGRL